VRISSPKNINICKHGVEGALSLSRTPIRIDEDAIDVLRKELENAFFTDTDGSLLEEMKNLCVSADDLKNTNML